MTEISDFQSEHFSFLGTNIAVGEMRSRSMFYTSLGRLLMVDLGEDEERFYNFMVPITSESTHRQIDTFISISVLTFSSTDSFESIGSILMDNNGYPSDEAKKALIGLSRDLRGLAFSSNTRSSYMMFFDWM